MATRRLPTKQRRGRDLSPEFEAFLGGDDSALGSVEGLRTLAAEFYFIQRGVIADSTDSETARLAILRKSRADLSAREALEQCRSRAEAYHVLTRFTFLLNAGAEPMAAFTEAIGPGPHSRARDVPLDSEIPRGRGTP